MQVIDVRLRPPFKTFQSQFKAEGKTGYNSFMGRFGFDVPESVRQKNMDLFFQEMDHAGITMGIAAGRDNRNYSVPTDEIVELQEKYPDRFRGLVSLDPLVPARESIDKIKKYVVDGPLTGVHFEPGGSYPAYFGNDAKFYPIYEFCQAHSIPLMTLLGGRAGPNVPLYTNPTIVTQLALDFPGINWIITHGGWPWVQPILGACYWISNIYLSPDLYMPTGVGTQDYINAGNTYMQDRIVFGSAYPLFPMDAMVELFKKSFKPEVLPKIMYKNAARLFNIDLPQEENNA